MRLIQRFHFSPASIPVGVTVKPGAFARLYAAGGIGRGALSAPILSTAILGVPVTGFAGKTSDMSFKL